MKKQVKEFPVYVKYRNGRKWHCFVFGNPKIAKEYVFDMLLLGHKVALYVSKKEFCKVG